MPEQIFMVIDACHAAAAVEVEGFKPGPMGNPGLGQLSYDKRMPILAATQAADSAYAKEYSLLISALAQVIKEEQAAHGGAVALREILRHSAERVPTLYQKMVGKERRKRFQKPKLFDFERSTLVGR